MKRIAMLAAPGLLAMGMALAQGPPAQGGPPSGGRHMMCDKDGDGKCDHCGKAVGQMQGRGHRRGGRHANCPNCPNCGNQTNSQKPAEKK